MGDDIFYGSTKLHSESLPGPPRAAVIYEPCVECGVDVRQPPQSSRQVNKYCDLCAEQWEEWGKDKNWFDTE